MSHALALAQFTKVVALDQRGTLRSQAYAEGEAFSLTETLLDIEALRTELGVERWAVLGHSYGGHLGVLYALIYPQSVTALLLESPTAGSDWHFLNRIAQEAGLPREDWANSARTRALVLAEGSIYQSIIHQLSGLTMPVLLMKGEHDPVTCERQVAAFRAEVPNGRVERFANSGHWIRHEESERYVRVVRSFLSIHR